MFRLRVVVSESPTKLIKLLTTYNKFARGSQPGLPGVIEMQSETAQSGTPKNARRV